MKKLLRILPVFIFSSLMFLMFLAGSGIIRVKGAEIGPGIEALDLRESVNSSLGRLLVSGPDEYDRLADSVAAPDADVDLEIVVFDDPDPVIAGTQITYTVVITNNGPSEAANVEVINDFPPSKLSFIDSSPKVCEGQGNIVTCTLGTLGIGLSTQFDLLMGVKSGATDPLLNPITVSSIGDTEMDPSNNSETEVTTIEYEYDLAVTKVDSVDPVALGGELIYTVTVDNTDGPSDAYGVILTDTLPIEVDLVSIASTLGACSDTVCTLGTLTAGNSASVIITTSVASTASGSIINTAQINNLEYDTEFANNISTETTTIEALNLADLTLTKSDSPDPVAPGGYLTYTLEVINNGPDDATSVVVTDTLPGEVNLVSITPSQGICNEITMECDLGTLGASLSADVTLVTTVTQSTPLGTIITNIAGVSSPDDPTPNKVEEPTTVSTEVDLSVTKSASPTVIAGESLVYTITVSNSSLTYDAPNVEIVDTLPVGVTFVASNPGAPNCTQVAGIVTCNLDTLAADSSTDVTINVTVDPDASGPLTNAVVVSSDANDPYETDNQDTTQTTVTYSADISLSTVDDPDPVNPGETLIYYFTIDNDGPSDTDDVVLEDTLPTQVAFVSISPSQGSCGGTNCDLGPIAAGGSANVTLVTTVSTTAPVGTTITNTAVVSSPDDSSLGNNSDDETTFIEQAEADLSITKSGFPDLVAPYDPLTYTLTVHNSGPDSALNVVITDDLPVEVSYLSSQPESLCDEFSGVVTCNMGTLPDSDSFEVIIVVQVDPMAVGPLENQAHVSSDALDTHPNDNTTSEETEVVQSANLALSTTHIPEPADPGDTLVYTLIVTNDGPYDATGVVLTDALPVEVTFLESNPESPTCEHADGIVVCNLGTINQGSAKPVVLVTKVAADALGTITNTAVVSSDLFDPVLGDNLNEEYATIGEGADLSLTKSGYPNPVLTGGILTYTLTVANGGPLTATKVSLQDTLPGNVTFVSSKPESLTCIDVSGVVNCDLGAMDSGEIIDISIIVQAATSSIDPLINQATVESATFDQDDTNNSASETTTVVDLEAPDVEWIYPVGDDQVFDVTGEVILLEVKASDNVAIARVEFLWWDHEYNNFVGRWVDIGKVYIAPYSIEFDTSILYNGYNQVYARAYDTSGNVSNRPRILLYRLEYAWAQYLPLVSKR